MSETMSMVFAPLGSWEVLCETGGDFLRIKTIYPFTVTRDVEPTVRHQVAQWIRVENLPEIVTEEILTPNRERLYSGQTRAFLRRLRGHLDAGEVTSFGDATVVDYQDRKYGFHPPRDPGLVLSETGLTAHAARQLATSPEAPLVMSTLHWVPSFLNQSPPACQTKPANWLMSPCEKLVM